MLSCQVVAEIASRGLDEKLTWRKRFSLRSHLAFCHLCRRYVRNLQFLDRTFKRARDEKFEYRSIPERLPEEARERIRRAIEEDGRS